MAEKNSGPFTTGSFENSLGFGGLNNFFDPGGIFQPPPNPADGAMPYLNQIGGMLPQYFQPWMNAGKQALPQLQQQYGSLLGQGSQLQNEYGQMASDPTGVMNRMGSTFQQSPGYQFQANQAMGAANRAASAGGMIGTPAEQQSIASTVGGLANQDYYNYLNHGMSMMGQGLQGASNLYGMGLQGEQQLAGMGYDASKSLGEDLSSALMSQAQLAYSGQSDVNQGRFGMLGSVMGAGGGLLAGLL
jgi:hypothetical protein